MRRDCARRAGLAVSLAVAACALAPSGAFAAITGVFSGHTVSASAVACAAQSDGVRVCHGDYSSSGGPDMRLASFDGTPLTFYVVLPPAPASGADGNYPLIVQSHGWGGSAGGPTDTQYGGPTADAWAKQGFAVLQLTARGFGDSCGSAASRLADPSGCVNGYVHLDDERYEVRDIQYATGLLVDEGVVDPHAIGVTGESYGGGVSLELATLKDRVMNADGTLSPWTSPDGTPLSITAAAPVIPWSDLDYALIPNGRTLDYEIASPTTDLSPVGVEKQSYVSGLYAEGNESGYYAPAGTNSQDDLTSWFAELNAGEPYDTSSDQALVSQIAQYHSAYYLLDGAYGTAQEEPPPMLIANGFTDDLFPVDEALRYYNLEQALYPGDTIDLFDWDGGHPRGQNKAADAAVLSDQIDSFLTAELVGPKPATSGVVALTETCPSTAPSGGPFTADTWADLHPGEVDYASAAAQTVTSGSGSPTISAAIDPITGQGACASVSATDQGSGVATYRLPAAAGAGYTLLGAPTVIADLSATGQYPLLAERLWDVDPTTNTETLVARGLYRLDPNSPNGVQVFQLHPGAWHFAAGHVPKLELLGADSPYARTSNGQFSISVSDLQLRLPVHEAPGSSPGVTGPLAPVIPGAPSGGQTSVCIGRPASSIAKRKARASRRGFSVSGTARELKCAGALPPAARSVKRVYVSVYRNLAHGRCRYLLAGGRLGRARPCSKPIEFRARGTAHWRLNKRLRIPAGRYLIRADAVDGFGTHQRRSGASVVTVRVR